MTASPRRITPVQAQSMFFSYRYEWVFDNTEQVNDWLGENVRDSSAFNVVESHIALA